MIDRELKFPEWQRPLRELLLGFDPEKLPEKIQKVETLIFERLKQIAQESDGHVEKAALYDGLNIVRMVKRDKLGSADLK